MSSDKHRLHSLILMRHAEPLSGTALDDLLIPLSDSGKERERKLCLKMKERGIAPDIIISSPCLRAEETAEIAASIFNAEYIIDEALLEPFKKESLLDLIRLHSKKASLAFVGHGPSLTELANALLQENRFRTIFSKSSAAVLQLSFNGTLKGTLRDYIQ